MSEAGVLEDGAPVAPASTDQAITAGALLRQAREAAGLHAAALAVALKVPVGKLEALEQDRYELLPDAVFTRALASAVCRNLKVDPRPVLDRLPQTTAPRLAQDTDGLNAPFRSPRDGAAPQWRDQLTRPVSLAVAALLVGALVVVLLPKPGPDDAALAAKGPDQPALAEPESATAAAPGQGDGPLMTTSVVLTPAAPAAAAGTIAAHGESPAAAGAPAPAATSSAAVAKMTAAPTGGAAPATTDGTVVFRTSGAAWVEVRDAKGAVPLRRLLAAGESAAASGTMPLQVTVGKVDATEVQVRGKAFDLKPYARDNVARFEVQ